jgi:hypothetical protein
MLLFFFLSGGQVSHQTTHSCRCPVLKHRVTADRLETGENRNNSTPDNSREKTLNFIVNIPNMISLFFIVNVIPLQPRKKLNIYRNCFFSDIEWCSSTAFNFL